MTEKFLEPQNPLKKIDETTGDITYVYPMTTAKQVIMDDDGTRLNTILTENLLYLGESEDEMSVAPVDADTLGGKDASEYATKEYVDNNSISTYTHSTGVLIGTGENGKFKATATGTYTAFTIGGVSYAVKAGGETEIELTSGVWYSFILDADAKTINFKAGGGVGNSKLALATATESDVLSGAKFYAGDKTLKTGTFAPENNIFYGQMMGANGYRDVRTVISSSYVSGLGNLSGAFGCYATINEKGFYKVGMSAMNTENSFTATMYINGSQVKSSSGNGHSYASGVLELPANAQVKIQTDRGYYDGERLACSICIVKVR